MTRSKWLWLSMVHAALLAAALILGWTRSLGMLPLILGYGASMGGLTLIGAWVATWPDHLADYRGK